MRDNPGIPEHTKCLRPEGATITEHDVAETSHDKPRARGDSDGI